jgi:hypothetical protein
VEKYRSHSSACIWLCQESADPKELTAPKWYNFETWKKILKLNPKFILPDLCDIMRSVVRLYLFICCYERKVPQEKSTLTRLVFVKWKRKLLSDLIPSLSIWLPRSCNKTWSETLWVKDSPHPNTFNTRILIFASVSPA